MPVTLLSPGEPASGWVTGMALFDPALLQYVDEQRAFNTNIMEATSALGSIDTSTPEGLAWIRDAMKPGGLFGFQTFDFPEVREIPGPAGPIPIRVMTPEVVDGVYLHYHGGGMTMGSALSMDARNWQIAEACNLAIVSVDYRLAPEHPFPAGPDDAEAAALWLIGNAQADFGTDRLLVGGESAGAYLALLTMVRLRDRLGGRPPFAGADLCYGVYDWGGTPSAKQLVGKVPYATGEGSNRQHYLPGYSVEEARNPAISPLWAALQDLPPSLLTVGTSDWLLDDSTFVAARLQAAGSPVELAVYPQGPHGIDSSPTVLGKMARERLHAFLRECVSG
jgi:acetyl esterase